MFSFEIQQNIQIDSSAFLDIFNELEKLNKNKSNVCGKHNVVDDQDEQESNLPDADHIIRIWFTNSRYSSKRENNDIK